MPPHARSVSTEQCREVLGDHTFILMREAMLQQQDTFQHQLWETHRLARVQGHKSLVASTEAALGLRSGGSDPSNCIFSRSHQAHMKAVAMQRIVSLPTLPASLRRSSPKMPAGICEPACDPAPQLHGTGSLPAIAPQGRLAASNSSGLAENVHAGSFLQPSHGTSGFDALLKATPSVPAPVAGTITDL